MSSFRIRNGDDTYERTLLHEYCDDGTEEKLHNQQISIRMSTKKKKNFCQSTLQLEANGSSVDTNTHFPHIHNYTHLQTRKPSYYVHTTQPQTHVISPTRNPPKLPLLHTSNHLNPQHLKLTTKPQQHRHKHLHFQTF